MCLEKRLLSLGMWEGINRIFWRCCCGQWLSRVTAGSKHELPYIWPYWHSDAGNTFVCVCSEVRNSVNFFIALWMLTADIITCWFVSMKQDIKIFIFIASRYFPQRNFPCIENIFMTLHIKNQMHGYEKTIVQDNYRLYKERIRE
jgi:hypothetical protein